MESMEIEIRTMREEEIPLVIDIRRKHNEFLSTPFQIVAWFKMHPESFKVAISDEGVILGTCAAVVEHDKLCHIGMYFVHEKYQGLGIGMKLWNAVWEVIGNRDVVLTATPKMLPKYSPTFPVVEPRYKRVSYGTDSPVNTEILNDSIPEGITIEPFRESHLSAIFDYDFRLFGYKRQSMLQLSCREGNNCTFVALRNGFCVGFGTIRTGCGGHGVVAPLYCDNVQVAEVLLKKLINASPSTTGLVMTTTDSNIAAIELMTKLGCESVDEAFVMYTREQARNKISRIHDSKVFGIFWFNFAVL